MARRSARELIEALQALVEDDEPLKAAHKAYRETRSPEAFTALKKGLDGSERAPAKAISKILTLLQGKFRERFNASPEMETIDVRQTPVNDARYLPGVEADAGAIGHLWLGRENDCGATVSVQMPHFLHKDFLDERPTIVVSVDDPNFEAILRQVIGAAKIDAGLDVRRIAALVHPEGRILKPRDRSKPAALGNYSMRPTERPMPLTSKFKK